ncbi:hypothetical protein [Streptomyces fractus]|uniref:hypothetical protein n=1 Tax=Streptomyces fractus TaxID=641806 RepID=UPI003CE967A7
MNDEPTTVHRPVRMCVWCEVITNEPVLVAEVHQGTGPGFNVYACPECASAAEMRHVGDTAARTSRHFDRAHDWTAPDDAERRHREEKAR